MLVPSASETSPSSVARQPPSLPAVQLNRRCRPEEFAFRRTAEIADGDGVITQERALAALELAMRIGSWSHDAYVAR
jgi:hypothetical protein